MTPRLSIFVKRIFEEEAIDVFGLCTATAIRTEILFCSAVRISYHINIKLNKSELRLLYIQPGLFFASDLLLNGRRR